MKRVAVLGTGIAGMACAAKIFKHCDLTVYEKNNYVGGHTNTVVANEDGHEIPIDTGFMVYNETTYPNLTQLFKDLGVKTKPTSMSFSVQDIRSDLEFAGTGFNGLFAQRRNLLRPSYYRFLRDIDRFNSSCAEVLNDRSLQEMTVAEYCKSRNFSTAFQQQYLIPMSAAVWSSPPGKMLEFPILTLVRFFTNHRFLSLTGQLVWRTVEGGSREYRNLLIKPFADRISVNRAAVNIQQHPAGVKITDTQGNSESYDFAIIAAHADEAIKLLENPTESQSRLLSKFRYQLNRATLHTDEAIMPKSRRAWTSWNYRVDPEGPSTIYWMNSLQGVSKKKNYFVSINDPGKVRQDQILKVIDYEHPLYTVDSVNAQRELHNLNTSDPVLFCGSYFNYGFHEDALTSGLNTGDAFLRRLESKNI